MADEAPAAAPSSRDLPSAVCSWIEGTFGGRIARAERSVSRREGWLLDVEGADGHTREGFLRLERFSRGRVRQPSCRVRHETAVIQALHARGLRVPAVLAESEELQATLFERVPGRDGIHELTDARQQREIATDFMRELARVHALPVSELDLPRLALPTSAEEFALEGIDDLERGYAASVDVPDPLAVLTFAWLRRNVPTPPPHPSLVQGDTGPGNFVFVGDRVSAILDWEQAHLGDPMEDLGHLYSRAFFHPWGDMSELLATYRATAAVDEAKLHFYRIASFAKAALGSTIAVNHFRPEGPLPMMIFFSIAGERGLAQSLSEALGAGIEHVSLPEPDASLPGALSLPTERISEHIVDEELLPQLATPYLQDRAVQLRQVARYQARRERYLSAVVEQELDELRSLSEAPVRTIPEGLAQLNARIEAWDEGRLPEIARYLSRRAQRAEDLAAPLAGRYANPVLSPI